VQNESVASYQNTLVPRHGPLSFLCSACVAARRFCIKDFELTFLIQNQQYSLKRYLLQLTYKLVKNFWETNLAGRRSTGSQHDGHSFKRQLTNAVHIIRKIS